MRFAIGLLIVAATGLAHADDIQKADELFAQAQKLREAGKTKEACDAFADSLQHNPNAIGTILNVARCAEESGKIASAVRAFSEARDRAREQNLAPQQQVAEEHLATLEGRAPHLAIAFAEPPTHETGLVVDDHPVDITSAGDILVDPGAVKIVVSAPGRVPFETSVTIAEKEHKALAVPKLGFPVTVKKTRQTYGKVILGVGVVAAITGEIIGLKARSDWKDAVNSPECTKMGNNYVCDTTQYSNTKNAVQLGDTGTGVGIAGLVLAGAGAVLWFWPSHEEERRVAFYPAVGFDQAGLVAAGRF